jgi:hypothetical protein
MGVCCSHVVHRRARMRIVLNVIAIIRVGVVAVQFEVKVGTKDGWAWMMDAAHPLSTPTK